MTLKRLFISLGRRWYLTIAGVLITLGLCYGAYANTEPTLQRAASDLLVPGTTTIPEGGNPYLYLGGLGQLSDVLVSSLNSEKSIGALQERFPHTTIVVGRDTSTSGPMITMTVRGTDDAAVAGALAAVSKEVPQVLATLQTSAAVPEKARISVITLTSDDKSTVIQKGRFETVGMIGAAGLVLTILLVGLIDGLVIGRRERAPERAAEKAAKQAGKDSKHAEELPKKVRKAPASQPVAVPVPVPVPVPESVAADASADKSDDEEIDWASLLEDSAPRAEREGSER
jgi:hypothetical protein